MVSPTSGVVAAGNPQTSEAGAALLRAGGNAVDAAVGAALAACVCEMPLASPMGGGVAVIHPASRDPVAVDFFARTPGLHAPQTPDLDFDHVEVDFGATTQLFHVGRASAAVPLALKGLREIHERYGRLPFEQVVEPAAELGRSGYVLSDAIAFVFELLEPIAVRSDGSRLLYFDGSELGRGGARLYNRDLADCLTRVAHTPELLDELYALLAAEFGPERGGLITSADLQELRVEFAEPLQVSVRSHRVSTMSAPSSGGALVALGLRLLEGRLQDHEFLSPGYLHAITSVQRLLLDVRDEHFDERCKNAAFVKQLLGDERVEEFRAGLAGKLGHGADNPLGSTTHISAIDGEGSSMALTLTNGEGSGHVLSGTGIMVNNLMGEEDLHPRGFHTDPPGTHLCTMMAPSIAAGPDDHVLALGSGGSNRLRDAILLTLAHLLEKGEGLERAVTAARLHMFRSDGEVRLAFERAGLSALALQELRSGFPNPVEFAEPNMFFGGVHVAERTGSRLGGMGDARRGGSVRVVSS